MVEISKDARMVLQFEAQRLHGYTERNTLVMTGWIAVGRDPTNPSADDGFVRVEQIAFEVVVRAPEKPEEWAKEMGDLLKKAAAWFEEHSHLDPGAFAAMPQPIRLNRQRDGETEEVGILDGEQRIYRASQ